MVTTPMARRIAIAFAMLAVLVVLRWKPWVARPSGGAGLPSGARETLTVGFLPVT